jgi:hypothetical protein
MQDTSSQDNILKPEHWKVWLAIGAVGLVATFAGAVLFGVRPIDALTLKNDALAPFVIFDLVLIASGIVQASRHAISRRGRN